MSLHGICVGDRADRPVPDGGWACWSGACWGGWCARSPGRRSWPSWRGRGTEGAGAERPRPDVAESLGLLRCPVVIVDLGLDREGLAVAQRLALRWPVVDLYRPEDGAEAH